MKTNILILLSLAAMLALPACNDSEKLSPSDDLGLIDRFSPSGDEDPRIISAFNDYGVWIRMEMTDLFEIYKTPLVTDNGANWYAAAEIEPQYVNSALVYAQTLLGNTSKEFTNAFFPLEWWMVKSYGGGSWNYQVRALGRTRFILRWPNGLEGALPEITDPADHYYQDSVVTYNAWYNLALSCAYHMEHGIKEFTDAGKAYDNGEAVGKIRDQYYNSDREKYDELIAGLCADGGFITSGGAGSFSADFAGWLALVAMESYENIKAGYLDNSPARKAKYEVFVKFMNSYGWDIQAAGDKYRRKYDEYLATLP